MKRALACAAALALAACGSSDRDEVTAPEPAPSATIAAPRTLVGSDFDPAMLGAKVEGPQGAEVESAFQVAGGDLATMTTYVACPAGVTVCDPDALPRDTVYTYVHRVTLDGAGEEIAPSPTPTGSAGPSPSVPEIGTTLFRTARPAAGFNLSVGYDQEEAETALGGPDGIAITLDEEQIIWRATRGSGWKPGSTITFWWQSTLPPERLENAYTLLVNGQEDSTRAPFPSEPKNP